MAMATCSARVPAARRAGPARRGGTVAGRRRAAASAAAGRRAPAAAAAGGGSPNAEKELSIWGKIKAAWEVFFPPDEEKSARLEAKRRLRMILVADRCAMSPQSLSEMKGRIVDVVSDFVEVDGEDSVDVSMSADAELGTLYAVSIPVKRVRKQFDDDALDEFGAMGVGFVDDDGRFPTRRS